MNLLRCLRQSAFLSCAWWGRGLLFGAVISCGSINPAPEVPSVKAATIAEKPVVAKIHATWCPTCLAQRGDWSVVYSEYRGRVHFVVFDVTDESTEADAREQARHLGLEAFLDEYQGETGTVAVIDGATGEVIRAVSGGDAQEYRDAIEFAFRSREAAHAGEAIQTEDGK